jgi:NADH-quinone oxidoreductase subunit N
MFVGNILALSQVQLKRMFAYSSIAHTGYLLVGLLTLSGGGHYEAVLAYLVGYSVMNFGAFAVLAILAGREDRKLTIADMAGLSERRPGLAFAMAVFLFSMAGMPPLAGFVTKYSLFYTALASGEVLLVVLAVLCSAISVYYYLRVLVFMYMKKPPQEFAGTQEGSIGVASLSVGLMAVLTLLLGVLPSGLFVMAKQAVTSLVQ